MDMHNARRSRLVLFILLLAVIGVGVGFALAQSPTSATVKPNKPLRPVVGMPHPARGFVRGHVTAVGDSVMVDYETLLAEDIPNIAIDAQVGMQFTTGIAKLQELRRSDHLGATVIVALGTNGPLTPELMDQLLATLAGASRIVLVTNYVDQPWQNANNALIIATAKSHPHIVVANWAARAKRNPQWLYSDGTHLPIDGPGARELAWIIRQAVHRP